ncbi:uncharacterized protein TM35_000281320 [Trypanosoma theileri]|uniref:Uncharacterized protein n=1 Tax=Trypanosoma theileri TaxID=67003 RepID=A0A1X0NNX2_9TRYP|nr:uncharacterized protein TM35_000281320 [Trypanosoma theileri]ORC86416.1 hypothetical protein TM35_000281320 [Trypanosoma theileri]
MQEAVYAAQITPSSVCSYPTYTPPPPLPKKKEERSPIHNQSPTRRRTFPEECNDILRVIHESSTRSSTSSTSSLDPTVATAAAAAGAAGVNSSSSFLHGHKSNGIAGFRMPSTTHEKYRAILNEVEHLNRLLEVTVEDREDVEAELRGKLRQAQTDLRDRDAALLQKDSELLHLRGAVEGLTMKLEACKHHTHHEENPNTQGKRIINNNNNNNENNNNNKRKKDNYIFNGSGGSSSSSTKSKRTGEWDDARRNSNIHSEVINASEKMGRSSRSNSNSVEGTAADMVTYSSSNNHNYHYNNDSNNNTTFTRLAQSAIKWVKFLLGRYFSSSSTENNEKFSNLLNILNELQEYSTKMDVDASLVRSLCTKVSNSLVEVVKVSESKNQTRDHERVSSGVLQTVSDREGSLMQIISDLEKERDKLKHHVSVVAGENVQLLHQIKSLENGSLQGVALPARMDRLEVQNAMLMAERDRQSAFIDELKQQLQRAKLERMLLQEELRRKTSH